MDIKCLPLLAAALCLSSCVVYTTGPVQHDSRSVERDASERVHVNLNMGAGNLIVGGGARKLLNADFTYNVASWEPEVRYSNTGTQGELTIRQPEQGHAQIGRTRYEWDLALNDGVPMDLSLHFGAGEARLRLGSLSLRSVEVDMGVGKLDMDLRGNPQHNYDVSVRGGIGEATVRLPAGVGVYAEGAGGIGEIKTEGLRREGGHWVNDAYEDSKVRIHLDIHGGIGSIRLIAD
ncbi:MAG: toast rack family protein [Bryobacteraceae bacterium]